MFLGSLLLTLQQVGLEHANEDVREISSAVLVGVEASLILSPLELVRIQGQNNGKG